MLGAGAVIIQPSSGKVVIVQDGDRWFLPKGRKDLGESIEHAALREAYEEVRVSIPFPLSLPVDLPSPSLATDANSCRSITGRTPRKSRVW
jgi:8-oxo-dGTP pyrophosphatase MutT (NUDIX family)